MGSESSDCIHPPSPSVRIRPQGYCIEIQRYIRISLYTITGKIAQMSSGFCQCWCRIGEAQMVLVLEFLGYQPCPLQRVVNQIVGIRWMVKSTYLSIPLAQAAQRSQRAVLRASCSQPSMGSLTGFSIPVRFLG